MRSITGFLAAAGLALAAPAAAYPGSGVTQDAYVGSRWAAAPSIGAAVAAPTLVASQDAFVGANWDRTPGSGAPSTALAAAKPDPRPSSTACTCVAHK